MSQMNAIYGEPHYDHSGRPHLCILRTLRMSNTWLQVASPQKYHPDLAIVSGHLWPEIYLYAETAYILAPGMKAEFDRISVMPDKMLSITSMSIVIVTLEYSYKYLKHMWSASYK